MKFIVHNVHNFFKIIPYAMLSHDYDCSFTVSLWNARSNFKGWLCGLWGFTTILHVNREIIGMYCRTFTVNPPHQPSGFLQLFLTQILIICDSLFLLKVHSTVFQARDSNFPQKSCLLKKIRPTRFSMLYIYTGHSVMHTFRAYRI